MSVPNGYSFPIVFPIIVTCLVSVLGTRLEGPVATLQTQRRIGVSENIITSMQRIERLAISFLRDSWAGMGENFFL